MFITPDFSNTVKNQMLATDSLLATLEKVLTNPVVAGGAPRDWFFNYRAKDIDIFVDPVEDIVALSRLINSKIPTLSNLVVKTSDTLPEQYRSDHISGVISFKLSQLEFQIIVKSNTDHPFLHFPCSICMIEYKDFSIIPTKYFLSSVRSSQLSFVANTNHTYMQKILTKFYNYRVDFVDGFYFPVTRVATVRETGVGVPELDDDF